MASTILENGTYVGKTLPQIIFLDHDHFFWAVEKDIFKRDMSTASEARELAYKARNIRIPEGMKAEYWIHRPTGKFDHMNLLPEDRIDHEEFSKVFYRYVIDLSVSRQISNYDKTGY